MRRLDHPEASLNPEPGSLGGPEPSGETSGQTGRRGGWRGVQGALRSMCPHSSREVATGCHPCTMPGAGSATSGPAHCRTIPGHHTGDGGTGTAWPAGDKSMPPGCPGGADGLASLYWPCLHPHAQLLVPQPREHAGRRDAGAHFNPQVAFCRVVCDPFLLLPQTRL